MNDMNLKDINKYLKGSYQVKSVPKGSFYWRKYLLSRCQNLFIYRGLPDTIPQWQIEQQLIVKGNAAVVKKNDKLYSPWGGTPYGFDVNFVPNKFTYANPIIGSDSNLQDGKDCAILWNSEIDKLGGSWLWDTIQRYARMLADLESTFSNITIYSRSALLAQVQGDRQGIAVDAAIKKMEVGDITTITNSQMDFNSIEMFKLPPITDFKGYTDARDYLINCFLNTIGLQTLEEKKEHLIQAEINQDNDILTNNSDIMYSMRCQNVDKINKTFGTNISVSKNKILING